MVEPKMIFIPDRSYDDLVTEDISLLHKFKLHNDTRKDVAFVDNPDDADIIILFEQFSFKLASYIEKLKKSQLFLSHAKKIYTINYDDIGQGFLPGCYTSLTKNNFDRLHHRACAYPKTYNEHVEATDPNIKPHYLFSFSGSLRTHPLRRKIYALLSQNEVGSVHDIDQRFHTHTLQQKQEYVKEILLSKFVLCPRGWSPSTYRLFEVMSLGRCPVIISDDFIFPDKIPWSSCSVRIPEHQISEIPKILLSYSDRWQMLGNEALKVWSLHFEEGVKFQSYLDQILELYSSHEELRVEGFNTADVFFKKCASFEFRWANKWTIPQKAVRRLSNAFNKLLR